MLRVSFLSSLAVVVLCLGALPVQPVHAGQTDPLSSWLPVMEAFAHDRLGDAIGINPSPCCLKGNFPCSNMDNTCAYFAPKTENGIPGAVQAATPYNNVDYYYSWTRDSALTMTTVVIQYESPNNPDQRPVYEKLLKNYVTFSQVAQINSHNSPSGGGLGEPKINFDGTVFSLPWCRPQNDGPALRVLAMIRFARTYNQLHPGDNYVSANLYNLSNPLGKNVIKDDLDYLVNVWNNVNCEPWEEVAGKHFYNRLVAYRAFVEGSRFAHALGDTSSAQRFTDAATSVFAQIEADHWNQAVDRVVPSASLPDYMDYTNKKLDQLDVEVLLAALHASNISSADADRYFTPDSDRILSSTALLVRMFANLYNLNDVNFAGWNNSLPALGTLIGRYHNDVYNGNGAGFGQAWFLAVHCVAEVLYKAVRQFKLGPIHVTSLNIYALTYFAGNQYGFQTGDVLATSSPAYAAIVTNMLQVADAQLSLSEFYAQNPSPNVSPVTTGNHMSEQINADTGNQQSALDLTWSYASFLTAKWARDWVNPERTVASFTPASPANTVWVNFVVTNVPQGSNMDTYIVGSIPALGTWSPAPCTTLKTSLHHTKLNGRSVVSALLPVPANTAFEWKPVMVPRNASTTCASTPPPLTWLSGPNLKFSTTALNPLQPALAVWDRAIGSCFTVRVTFYVTNYGQSGTMHVAGSDFNLGGFNTVNAVPMQFVNGQWEVTVPLPCNTANINWKPLVLTGGAPNNNARWTWACGGNAVFSTGSDATMTQNYGWC